jgi:hypothetical protein
MEKTGSIAGGVLNVALKCTTLTSDKKASERF